MFLLTPQNEERELKAKEEAERKEKEREEALKKAEEERLERKKVCCILEGPYASETSNFVRNWK